MSKPIGIVLGGLPLAALFVLLWSSGFVGVRLASLSAPVETALMWRSVVLTAALSPWLVRAVRRLGRAQLRREALIGLLSQTVYLVTVYYAIGLGVSSGTTALVDGIQPLVVAALAGPVLGIAVATRQWLGLALGLLAVVVVSGADLTSAASQASWWAYPIPLVGMAALVAATMMDRRTPRRASALQSLAVHCAVTLLATGLLAGVRGEALPPPTVAFWSAVAWLAVLSTLGGYGLYWLLLERRGVTHVNTLLFLVPPVTTAWGALWFGEPFGPVTVVGLALALVAVVLARGAAPEPTTCSDAGAAAPTGRATSPAAACAG